MRIDALVYDLEIECAVPDRRNPIKPGVKYCQGWTDYAGMGVAVLCAYDLYEQVPHIYLADNLDAFVELVSQRKHLIGFNSLQFDDNVLAAQGITVKTTYDLKEEAGGVIKGKRVPGRKLSDFARVNGCTHNGAVANHADIPELWQLGQRGTVIDECMGDVMTLVGLVRLLPEVVDPVTMRTFVLRDIREDSQQFDIITTQPARLSGGDANGG